MIFICRRKSMKKLVMILIALCLAGMAFAQGASDAALEAKTQKSDKLIMITSTAADNLNAVVPVFEEKYGIKVEIITGSTGEVYSRIQAEKDNPSTDITWIGEYYALIDPEFFESYVSANDSEYPEAFRNKTGFFTAVNGTCPVIIYNTSLVDHEINGYKDLLDPSLKGRIAFGDAGTSSSAYNHLENMLIDFGNGDVNSKAGWDFVEALLKQLDGRVTNSSSVTYKGVVSGEYAVGLAWDAPALQLVEAKTPNIKFCYMEEGSASKLSGMCIIKNARNLENAKLFVDFISSKEGQGLIASRTAGANPVRTDVELPESKAIMHSADIFPVDSVWSAEIKPAVQERFTNLLMDVMN